MAAETLGMPDREAKGSW